MKYTHPRTEVEIVDKSFIGVDPVETGLTLFAPVFSEKGVDNTLQHVTTPEAYQKEFGELNFREYGQGGHNTVNWLRSQGDALVLRLLPEDATYAHAILNIQTKTAKKAVLDYQGERVNIDDVTIRPTVMHLKTANSLNKIANALDEQFGKTVDGYTNNPFAAIIVKGRGRYYNRYGFRINLLNDYDETYDFRTYSFETLYTDKEGNTSVIEGPFTFSFEAHAMNISRQSIFLPNVLEQYSDVYGAIINEQNYYDLVDTINGDDSVPTGAIDVLSGKTRLFNGEPETYVNKYTNKEEDVHIALHEYNVDGTRIEVTDGVPLMNIINTDSEIQRTILEVDDTKRDLQYMEIQTSVENMRLALSRFRQGNYPNLVQQLADFDEDQELNGGKLKYAYEYHVKAMEDVLEAEANYNEDPSKENYERLLVVNDIAKDRIKELKRTTLEMTSVARAVASTPNLLDAIIEIRTADQLLGLNDVVSIGAAEKIDELLELRELVAEARQVPTSSIKLETVEEVLMRTDEIIRFAVAMDVEDEEEADEALELAKEQREETFNAYQQCLDEYILPSELDIFVKNALSQSDIYISRLRDAIDMVLVENALSTLKEIDLRINKLVIESIQAIKDSRNIAEQAYEKMDTREDLIENIKMNIDKESNRLKEFEFSRYKQVLRELTMDSVFLIGGTEGSLESKSLAVVEQTKKRLLLKALRGEIDPSITDKEIVEFDMVLDANYDDDVKLALASLITDIRDDACAVVDLNLATSPKAAIDARRRFAFDDFRLFLYGQSMTVYDEQSNSDILVTAPYFLASKLPYNERVFGLHQPLAGRKRGVVSGFKNLSWFPTKEWKTKLYNSQVNYIEVKPDKVNLATQHTSQRERSALSHMNNAMVVLRLRRRIERLCDEHRNELVDEDFLENLNRDLRDLSGSELDTGAYKDVSATAYANEYDLANNIYRVRFVVKFKDIVETILGTIEVTR